MRNFVISIAENAVKSYLTENATFVGTEFYKMLAKHFCFFVDIVKTNYENY